MAALLDPAAPKSDATWKQCFAGIGTNSLLAFDYDGTLAPIVADIGNAWMDPTTEQAFARLLGVAGARVALISGRESADVRRYLARVEPLAPAFVVGNHGADELDPSAVAPRLAQWRPQLAAAVAGAAGTELEEKALGFSLHWRNAADPQAAEQVLRKVTQSLQGARIIGGKAVLNVLPAEAPHKGHALARLASDCSFDSIFFVGDDLTDELAFEHEYPCAFTGVRIADASVQTAASYRLDEQPCVANLLERLQVLFVDLAPASSVAGL